MALAKDVAPEHDLGEWFDFGKDPDTGKLVRFRVRRVAPAVIRRIRAKHMGPVQTTERKRNGSTVESYNMDKSAAVLDEVCVLALVDSENFEIAIGDQAAADFYAKLLGTSPAVGSAAVVDGKLNDEAKARIFELSQSIMLFVNECLGKLDQKAKSEEDEAGKI